MTDQPTKTANAWLCIETGQKVSEFPYPQFSAELKGDRGLYSGIDAGDWVLSADGSGTLTRVGRVLRLRSDSEKTTVYFDRLGVAQPDARLEGTSIPIPKASSITRLQWVDFTSVVQKSTGGTVDDVPLLSDQAYIRELLQL